MNLLFDDGNGDQILVQHSSTNFEFSPPTKMEVTSVTDAKAKQHISNEHKKKPPKPSGLEERVAALEAQIAALKPNKSSQQ